VTGAGAPTLGFALPHDPSPRDPDQLPIPGSELTAAIKVASALRTFLRRPPPAAVLHLRVSRRDEIRANIGKEPEVLIVNAKKWDKVGQPDNRIFGRGASDWFKAEVKGAHDSGFEWFSAIEYVRIKKGKAFRADENSPGVRKVFVVGRLRYERITFIDWAPDPGSGSPRFYVEYSWRHEPYAEFVLYEDSGDHLYQLEGIKYVGVGRLKRTWRRLQGARFVIQQRRREKQWRDERYGG
jgi:hypothetical protein